MKKGIQWTIKDMSINSFQQLLKRFMGNEGFTLIELLMVVIILGILAAVVIPQFSGSTEDAKISALKSNLNSIRGAVELYQVQHNSRYPDPNIVFQLTRYTDADGGFSTTKTTAYKYGPYLKQGLPKNPFDTSADPSGISIDTTANPEIGAVAADETPTQGWKYVPSTGEFIANTSGYDRY